MYDKIFFTSHSRMKTDLSLSPDKNNDKHLKNVFQFQKKIVIIYIKKIIFNLKFKI